MSSPTPTETPTQCTSGSSSVATTDELPASNFGCSWVADPQRVSLNGGHDLVVLRRRNGVNDDDLVSGGPATMKVFLTMMRSSTSSSCRLAGVMLELVLYTDPAAMPSRLSVPTDGSILDLIGSL